MKVSTFTNVATNLKNVLSLWLVQLSSPPWNKASLNHVMKVA